MARAPILSRMDSEPLLHLYDTQLRDEAEVAEAPEVSRIGPLLAATWPERGRGFLTYRSIPKEMDLAALIDAALAHYVDDTRITQVEWKTRGHDDLPDLVDLLTQRGFEFEEQETVMAGTVESAIEAADPIPAGYGVIRATSADEIREAEALAGRVFGDTPADSATRGEALVARWEKDPESFEMWFVRGPEGQIVCSGRIDFVVGTEFAGLWGGACEAEHRGKGLYRALTAARAESAQQRGYRFLQSDCTEFSRPILQRAGLVPITTTTPAVWHREPTP